MRSIFEIFDQFDVGANYKTIVGRHVELSQDSRICEFCEAIFVETAAMSLTQALLVHKFKRHYDAVIKNTFFPRRVESGVRRRTQINK